MPASSPDIEESEMQMESASDTDRKHCAERRAEEWERQQQQASLRQLSSIERLRQRLFGASSHASHTHVRSASGSESKRVDFVPMPLLDRSAGQVDMHLKDAGKWRKLLWCAKMPSWLVPRVGEYSVDSEQWYKELWYEPFHVLVSLPLWALVGLFGLTYVVLIFVLAAILYGIGDENPNVPALADGTHPEVDWNWAMQVSWTSLTTVGYGNFYPVSASSSGATAAFTCFSIICDTVWVGILYQKLSAPNRIPRKTLRHSSRAVLASATGDPVRGCGPFGRRGHLGFPMRFECRIHHASSHAMVETKVYLTMARFRGGTCGPRPTCAGTLGRVCIEFKRLKIGNDTDDNLAFLQYPWSAVHWIDEESPLAEYIVCRDGRPQLKPSFIGDHVEIICTVIATAASTGSECESRISYTAETINVRHRFADCLRHQASGMLEIDLKNFDRTEPEDADQSLNVLPQCF